MDCFEEQIDQSLPLGSEVDRIFIVNGPDSLEAVYTVPLIVGTHLEFLHKTLGANAPIASLQYVLKSGAAPVGPKGYYVAPADFNGTTNNVHWALQKVSADGAACIYNADINGGTDGGGWNIPAATGDAVPQLNLSDSADRVLNHSDFD
jgi:hypothetical protein